MWYIKWTLVLTLKHLLSHYKNINIFKNKNKLNKTKYKARENKTDLHNNYSDLWFLGCQPVGCEQIIFWKIIM